MRGCQWWVWDKTLIKHKNNKGLIILRWYNIILCYWTSKSGINEGYFIGFVVKKSHKKDIIEKI